MTRNDDSSPPSFWDWSVSVYSRPGLAERLLRLQDDHGLDVNIVLWCLWAGRHHAPLEAALVREVVSATMEWSERVSAPLRTVRRWLKGRDLIQEASAVSDLRHAVKELELDSERIAQAAMERLTAAAPNGAPRDGAPADYFHIYLDQAGYLEKRPELEKRQKPGQHSLPDALRQGFAEIERLSRDQARAE